MHWKRLFQLVRLVLELGFLVSFFTFMILKPLTYIWQKFQVWGSWYENWSFLVRMFEKVRLVLELEFTLHFDDIQTFTYLWQNFQAVAYNIKIGGRFLVDFEKVRLIQKPKFLVKFCIFLSCNNILTDDKNVSLRLMTWKQVFFSRYIFLVSTGCSTEQKWSFSLRFSSVIVTKSAVSCVFSHMYWRDP